MQPEQVCWVVFKVPGQGPQNSCHVLADVHVARAACHTMRARVPSTEYCDTRWCIRVQSWRHHHHPFREQPGARGSSSRGLYRNLFFSFIYLFMYAKFMPFLAASRAVGRLLKDADLARWDAQKKVKGCDSASQSFKGCDSASQRLKGYELAYRMREEDGLVAVKPKTHAK